MALIKCNECGNEVSDKATSCPKCGAPVRSTPQPRVRTSEDSALTRNRGCADLLIYGVLAAVLLFVVISVSG